MKPKIKNLKLKNRFLLAPMLEPNDVAFRTLCKKAGCALTYTGMTNPLSKQKLNLQDKPALQLFTNNTKGIKQFIKKYDRKVSLWDFNLGCPSKLSKKLSHGAFMHDDIKSIEKILKTIRQSTKKPVTIKLRRSSKAIEIAKLAEQIGIDAVGIHPRTFSQGYSGKPDYEFALQLKKSVSIPIIYSGDVNEKNARKILKDFDFVFIGRAAIGNPNIFSKLTSRKPKIKFQDYLKLAKKYKPYFRQIKYHAMAFTKGMPNSRSLRRELIKAKTLEDIKSAYEKQ